MKTTTDAPPLQFEEAEQRFAAFLAENGYPPHVCWVTRRDVLVDDSGVLLIKKSETAAEEQSRLYGSGVTSGLGVALVAVCATSTSTYANVFVPKDVLDAQEHLSGVRPETVVSCCSAPGAGYREPTCVAFLQPLSPSTQ